MNNTVFYARKKTYNKNDINFFYFARQPILRCVPQAHDLGPWGPAPIGSLRRSASSGPLPAASPPLGDPTTQAPRFRL